MHDITQHDPTQSTWLAMRRAERAVHDAARRRGITTPDLYRLDDSEPTHNCLTPLAISIYFAIGRLPDELRPTVRRWCESIARAAGGAK